MKSLNYWNSNKVGAKYLFEHSDKVITLGLEFKNSESSNAAPVKKNEFFEGLWQYDLVEAFISTGEKSYLEINLSTTGAWWAAEFSDYRIKLDKKPEIKLIEVIISDNSVIAKFSYDNITLLEQYNITAILNKKYLSLNSINTKADFHLKGLRKELCKK